MKRTTLLILLLAMLVVSCFAFTACHKHEFGEWTITEQPTCTQAGSKERVCECGKKQREAIDTVGPHGFQATGVCQYCHLDLNDILIKRYAMSATADDNVYGYVVSGPNGDYEAYIIGTGAMMDYTLNKAPFSTDGYDIKNAYISNGVTRIAEGAFLNCTNLTNVTIGNSVTSIGDYAFQNCTGIASIDIPSNVTEIGEAAFVYCTNLTNLTIAEGVKSMGTAAFYGCSSLVSVTIPSTMTSISDRSFRECTSLVSVDIPSSVTSIENCAFQQCTSLTSIDIPSSVTQIGESAFLMCTGLTSITIPSGVTSIGDRAFLGCTNLKSVTFADPYGWYCNKTQGATSGIDLTLTDATQNANYLVSEDYYRGYWWYKIANN